ncbi:MAG: hydroxymethylbilane synthase, partial [Acidimicrobiia bacterium]|nr:hydroxymethylbilane synthase [Acidimicrobiia bacterium]
GSAGRSDPGVVRPLVSLRLATRQSPLALWQASEVARLLVAAHPGLDVDLIPTSTTADERLDLTIADLGGKGAFATQVQAMVAAGLADAAVHSAKDLPSTTGPGLVLAAVPERANPLDVLVGAPLDRLPEGATIRTGSARRRVQLLTVRPDLRFEELRGNIQTRLTKIPAGGAIVMAAAALDRLRITDPQSHPLSVDVMVPQVGQGTLAVECRDDDGVTAELLDAIEHGPSRVRLEVEREFLVELGGDCELPAGAYAELEADGRVSIVGILADPSGQPFQRRTVIGYPDNEPGAALAAELRSQLQP